MKNNNQIDINKAIAEEIRGRAFREMKFRFKELSSDMETENVAALIYEHPSAAAFSGFAKVANNPLPVTEKTLREFLGKDNDEIKTRKKKPNEKTNNKKDKNK
ncbi:MAG: hypothetical protein GXO89_16815 [Chlorobi bacterium]|nr:hypothetical protein [Chlorobiota bacterium]